MMSNTSHQVSNKLFRVEGYHKNTHFAQGQSSCQQVLPFYRFLKNRSSLRVLLSERKYGVEQSKFSRSSIHEREFHDSARSIFML